MFRLLNKLACSLMDRGLIETTKIIIGYPRMIQSRRLASEKWASVLATKSVEEKFNTIYKNNLWGCAESVSGPGSTLRYTENLRKNLPNLIDRFGIKKIFDAPCGDFGWMSDFLQSVRVSYIGADVVFPLIESHKKLFENERIQFIHMDIIKNPFPLADIMICRDCLFHLSFSDTRAVLLNYLASGIPYLLTTTHSNLDGFANRDIVTGDFRLIDLFSEPYNFPRDTLESIDDWLAPEPERKMCLWSREQVILALGCFGEGIGGLAS